MDSLIVKTIRVSFSLVLQPLSPLEIFKPYVKAMLKVTFRLKCIKCAVAA